MAVMGPILNMQIPKGTGRSYRNKGQSEELAMPVSEQDMYDDVDLQGRMGQAPRGEPQRGGSPVEALMSLLGGQGQGNRVLQAIQGMMGSKAQAAAPQQQMPVEGPMPRLSDPGAYQDNVHPADVPQASADQQMLDYIASQIGGDPEIDRAERERMAGVMTLPVDQRLASMLDDYAGSDGLGSPEQFYRHLDAALQSGEIDQKMYNGLMQEFEMAAGSQDNDADDDVDEEETRERGRGVAKELADTRSTRIDER